MHLTVFQTITNRFVTKQIIDEEDKALYQYGLEQGTLILAFVLTTMILGFLFQLFCESIFFFVAYSVLRMQAGGYHAKTKVRCYFISVLLIAGVLGVIAFVPYVKEIVLYISILATVIILFLAPVETENKPLDEIEIAVYKNRTRGVLLVELCLLVITTLVGANHVAMCIGLAIVLASMMVIAGKCANSKRA
jgi:accessory gene regulator B